MSSDHTPTRPLSASALRLIAMGCMLLDHVYRLCPGEWLWMRYIGRIAFPLFAFLLIEGYEHTRDLRRYALRLAAFAVISEVPFDLFHTAGDTWFLPSYQNVGLTLLFGLSAICALDRVDKQLLGGALAALSCILAYLCRTDYGAVGVALCVLFFITRGKGHDPAALAIRAIAFLLLFPPVSYASFAIFALFPIWFYNGQRGRRGRALQIAGYAFYPAHQLALAGLLAISPRF